MTLQHDRNAGRGKRALRFAHAASAVEATLRKAAAQRGFAERRLLTNWTEIVGADLARLCRPARLTWGRREEPGGAALVVEASGAAAPEVEHRAPLLIERVNAALGWRAVSRLRIDQAGFVGAGLAEQAAPYDLAPPTLDRRIEAHISTVEDGELREKLTRLARNIAARKETP